MPYIEVKATENRLADPAVRERLIAELTDAACRVFGSRCAPKLTAPKLTCGPRGCEPSPQPGIAGYAGTGRPSQRTPEALSAITKPTTVRELQLS
jgi:hypothetical protein